MYYRRPFFDLVFGIPFFFCFSWSSLLAQNTSTTAPMEMPIPIDSVWAGHPVGFSLLTYGDRQYIAYYNAHRNMVLGQRNLEDDSFDLHKLPATDRKNSGGTSTVLNWDSHNYVTLAVDKAGFIHLAGNMHVHPITYFRSTKPHDISEMIQVRSMVGTEEDRCTYPKFMKNREGELIFHYRDGGSGNGNEIYNIYSTESQTWSRLLDDPLTDGQGKMNAYQSDPILLGDNWYHVYWVWRDTPDCETNHDLSYIKSPDLKTWYNAFGEEMNLSVTIDNRSVIVDPIPVKGGIINLAARLVLDDDHSPVFVYHKYDEAGYLQFYIARIEDDRWTYTQITDWDYRWEFKGRGSIVSEVRIKGFEKRQSGYSISFYHIKYGDKTMYLNDDFEIIRTIDNSDPEQRIFTLEGKYPGLGIRTAADSGYHPTQDSKYVLKWETLPSNRDRPRPEPWPAPSTLYLYKIDRNSQ